MLNVADWLHAEIRPRLSHTRTAHQQRIRDFSAAPP
jgi:hypothetical protein